MSAVFKIVCHSKTVLRIAYRHGWLVGARYSNLRDITDFDKLGFLDIEWRTYNFQRHLQAAKATKPLFTVARDIEDKAHLELILEQAHQLNEYANRVIVVPKDPALKDCLNDCIPSHFLLGYSVATKYGGTSLSPECFRRPVHLLGGRPDVQRELAKRMPVYSMDCNRFTLDASYGDFFDGRAFRKHPGGGYLRCLEESITNINKLWTDYVPLQELRGWQTQRNHRNTTA